MLYGEFIKLEEYYMQVDYYITFLNLFTELKKINFFKIQEQHVF